MTTALLHKADEEMPCLRHKAEAIARKNPRTSTWTAVMSTLTLLAVVFDVHWSW